MSSAEGSNCSIARQIQAELDLKTISELEKLNFNPENFADRLYFGRRVVIEVLLYACLKDSQPVIYNRLVNLFDRFTRACEGDCKELSKQNFGRPLLRCLQTVDSNLLLKGQNGTHDSVRLWLMHSQTAKAGQQQSEHTVEPHEEQSQQRQSEHTVEPHEEQSQQQSEHTVEPHEEQSQQRQSEHTVEPHEEQSQQQSEHTVEPHEEQSQQLPEHTVEPHEEQSQQQSEHTVEPHEEQSQQQSEHTVESHAEQSQQQSEHTEESHAEQSLQQSEHTEESHEEQSLQQSEHTEESHAEQSQQQSEHTVESHAEQSQQHSEHTVEPHEEQRQRKPDEENETHSAILEVPDGYTDCRISALLYLIISEMTDAFLESKRLAVEIPCFVEMFFYSSDNNRNSLPALLGEFFALSRLCFHEEYYVDKKFRYRCVTKQFDFSIEDSSRKSVAKVSVKSVCFCCPKFFDTTGKNQSFLWNAKRGEPMKFVSSSEKNNIKANILLHNCDCRFCIDNPVQKVQVRGRFSSDKNCERHKEFSEIVKDLKKGTVYLMRTEMVFELRYALDNAEAEKYGRSKQRKLQMRDLLRKILNPEGIDGQKEISDPINVLVDRSSTE
ncbi:hypothetical protein BOX15_Mlig004560g1 [Macrostomum lignano]|uniref:Uncharacterized protein n=1 Tax=Macrostomum lignano TaxID=282301 RepID=A0A267F960_9PLAT|nr:hypothetical protein BOX15_Mlig004560g1 [Macrostomum lignano]